MKTLRIAVLADTESVSKYDFDFVQWATTQPDLEVSHLILRKPAPQQKVLWRYLRELRRDGVARLIARAILNRIVVPVERLLMRNHPVHNDHWRRRDLSHLVSRKVYVDATTSPSGSVDRFSAEDIIALANLKLDLIIRLGFGILRGDVLSCARLGVLSFHHGDNRINRGGPPGFWEVYLRQDTTGFVIQKLTEELDGGLVLRRGQFQTKYYFLLNQANVYAKSYVHMKTLIKDVAKTGTLPTGEEALPYSSVMYRNPLIHQIAYYALCIGKTIAMRLFERAFRSRFTWNVAFTRRNWRQAVLWRSSIIPNPAGRFLADPFVCHREGRTWCFVEDFSYDDGKAVISVFEIAGIRAGEPRCCIREAFHLSFPFIFEYENDLYMCPETHQNHDIRVYRCTEFPMKWDLSSILMTNVSAADTMLFASKGRWWMLTNLDYSGLDDQNDELYLFSADSPLATNWLSHPNNPIAIDPGVARNAGLIVEGGRLFRAAQRQAFDPYRKSVTIREISALSEVEYAERPVCSIDSSFVSSGKAVHHLSSSGDVTVIDICRRASIA